MFMRRDVNLLPSGITLVKTNDVVDPEYVPSDSDFDRMIREVFAVNPETGLPQGDIAYYLSRDGNPQVKAWLENNLLRPRAAALGTSIEGVTDDMIAEFDKRSDESAIQYADRLRGIYDDAVKYVNEHKDDGND